MRVYLAAAWSRLEEIRRAAQELRENGLEITSRWLDEPSELTPNARADFLALRAAIDLEDIRVCDVLVRFSDPLTEIVDPQLLTGARHTEMGYALALRKRIYVIGRCQNVFDYLPEVTLLGGLEALKYHLGVLTKVL